MLLFSILHSEEAPQFVDLPFVEKKQNASLNFLFIKEFSNNSFSENGTINDYVAERIVANDLDTIRTRATKRDLNCWKVEGNYRIGKKIIAGLKVKYISAIDDIITIRQDPMDPLKRIREESSREYEGFGDINLHSFYILKEGKTLFLFTIFKIPSKKWIEKDLFNISDGQMDIDFGISYERKAISTIKYLLTTGYRYRLKCADESIIKKPSDQCLISTGLSFKAFYPYCKISLGGRFDLSETKYKKDDTSYEYSPRSLLLIQPDFSIPLSKTLYLVISANYPVSGRSEARLYHFQAGLNYHLLHFEKPASGSSI